MADDIVTRLRAVAERFRYNTPEALAGHIRDASNEIERLRNKVNFLADQQHVVGCTAFSCWVCERYSREARRG